MHLLNCHPDIKCIHEPFNPNQYGARYLNRVKDLRSLDDTLAELWKAYNGIKHVWHSSAWPFGDKPEFNQHIVSSGGHQVLVLNRRNNLRRVVSSEISKQTGVWSISNQQDRSKIVRVSFKPLDIQSIKYQLDSSGERIAKYKQLLIEKRVEFMELWYEDLYDLSLRTEQRLDRLNQVLTFVGRGRITDCQTVSEIDQLFDPGNTAFNSRAIYGKVPGIEEIERRFGSDETGWLFEKAPSESADHDVEFGPGKERGQELTSTS